MKKENRKRKKRKSHREQNNLKLLVFPESKAEMPAFRNALWREFEQSIKNQDGQLRMKLAFPGRSLAEAQRIRASLTGLFEKDLWEACSPQGNVYQYQTERRL